MATRWLDGIKRLPRSRCRTAHHAGKVVHSRQLSHSTPDGTRRHFADQHRTHDDAARSAASPSIDEEYLYHSDEIEVPSVTGLVDAPVEEDWTYRLSRSGKGRESINAGSNVLRH